MTPRDAEIARYARLYASQRGAGYRMTPTRRTEFRALLAARPDLAASGLLDVGAGHGTALDIAAALGYRPLAGTEVAPALLTGRVVYGPAWDLPFADRSFGTVTCFDVLEHLLPEDVPAALREIARVAASRVLLLVSCVPSLVEDHAGQLHMTVWTPERWAREIRAAWPGCWGFAEGGPPGRTSALFEGWRGGETAAA